MSDPLMRRKIKPKLSPKQLKDLRGMSFVKREVIDHPMKHEIRDYFFHEKAQITLVRVLYWYVIGDKRSQYVNWTCPDFGGGNAGIGYWLKRAAKERRPLKKCSGFNCT